MRNVCTIRAWLLQQGGVEALRGLLYERDVHPIFARLLGAAVAECGNGLAALRNSCLLRQARELGDSLGKCSIFCEVKLPAFYDALRYVAMERSGIAARASCDSLARHSLRGILRIG